MRKISRGFTLIELLVVVSMLATIGLMASSFLLNTPGATLGRAEAQMRIWLGENNMTPKRASCSHDSDGDGYASCVVVTTTEEKVFLQCVSGWVDTMLGARGCKEVETTMKINRR